MISYPKKLKQEHYMGRNKLTLESYCKGTHFTWDERLLLQYYFLGSNGYKKIKSYTLLAAIFHKSPKTMKREIQRGLVEHTNSQLEKVIEYNAYHAQIDADTKGEAKGPAPKSGKLYELVNKISHLILNEHCSPYAVLHKLKEDDWPQGFSICEKTLYNWIEAGDIPNVTKFNLPRKGKIKLKKRHSGHRRHNNVEYAKRTIDKRPDEINSRQTCGHWEGDTVYSRKNGSAECIFTMVERLSRVVVILPIKDRTADSVKKAMDSIEKTLGKETFKKLFKSITFDNGTEFSDVHGLETSCFAPNEARTQLYFAHPYCSSERGSNENHNGIIRRFLPKGTDFADVSKKRIKQIQKWMNSYPRRILNGLTPIMVIKKELGFENRVIKIVEVA